MLNKYLRDRKYNLVSVGTAHGDIGPQATGFKHYIARYDNYAGVMGLYLEKNFRDSEQPFFNSYLLFSVLRLILFYRPSNKKRLNYSLIQESLC